MLNKNNLNSEQKHGNDSYIWYMHVNNNASKDFEAQNMDREIGIAASF